jgi:hypothetical protein
MEVNGELHDPTNFTPSEERWNPRPQSQSGHFGKEKNVIPLPEFEFPVDPAHAVLILPAVLFQLHIR